MQESEPSPVVLGETERDWIREMMLRTIDRPNWIQIGALGSIRRAMELLRQHVFTTAQSLDDFEAPFRRVQFQIESFTTEAEDENNWWQSEYEKLLKRNFRDRSHLVDTAMRFVEWYARFSALRLLTNDSTILHLGGRSHVLPAKRFYEALETSTPPERDAILRAASRPAYLCSVFEHTSPHHDDAIRVKAREVARWKFNVKPAGEPVPVSIFAMAEPLVRDTKSHRAYFPVTVDLKLPQSCLERLGLWNRAGIDLVWSVVQRHIDDTLESYGEVVSRHRPVVEQHEIAKSIKHDLPLRPRWDKEGRALFVGEYLVKRYRQASDNQTIVLLTFEDDGWPEVIDDPLPQVSDVPPKKRLASTIESLNGHHANPGLISFHAARRGEGVRYVIGQHR